MTRPALKNDSEKPPVEQISSISEAAKQRQVSERTVYRMLKKGLLERVNNDKNVVTKTNKNIEMNGTITQQGSITSEMIDKLTSKVSDILTAVYDARFAEITRRQDELIATLLTREKDLMATNQKLQEQMAEMARLILTQRLPQTPQTGTEETPQTTKRSQGTLRNLLKRFDNGPKPKKE